MHGALTGPTGPTGPAIGRTGPTGPTGPSGPVDIDMRNPIGPTGSVCDESDGATIKVVQLAERAQEVIAITELPPAHGQFSGKRINHDRSITKYPDVKWWRQRVALAPATISHLFAYLREA